MTEIKIPDGDFLLLVDASSYFHRAYHAAAKTVRRADGQETGAIINFCWSMMKLLRLNRTAIGRRPSHAAIICDTRGKNFRHTIFPGYKANRAEYEDGLESQLHFIPTAADAFNLPCIGLDGYEADDIIATYADLAPREDLNVVIASSDKDLMQMVSESVFMYDAMKDRDFEHGRYDASNSIIDIDAVRAKWGVWPWEMIDFQALVGDAVDNVPGVYGIGPKKAAALIKKFGTVEAIIEAADWGPEGFNPKEHAAIVDSIEEIAMSKRLVELARNAPLELGVDDLRLHEADVRKLKAFFMDLEAPQLARRVDF